MVKARPSAKSKKRVKKPAKKRRKAGRPTLKIDLEDLGKLAGLQCTRAEAAAFFGCSEETIKRRLTQEKYREVWEAGKAKGRMSLRRSQFRMAEKNATMAIWLGKQYLGQRDVMVHQGGAGEELAIVKIERIIIPAKANGADPGYTDGRGLPAPAHARPV